MLSRALAWRALSLECEALGITLHPDGGLWVARKGDLSAHGATPDQAIQVMLACLASGERV